MDDQTKFSKAALYIALAVALLGVIALPALAAADPPRALLTIADGPVELVRGAARFRATEGLALAGDDIVRTEDDTRIARIEFADGRVLDLGPATQALLLSDASAAAQGLAGTTAVVIQGWAKLGVPAAVNAGVTPGARLAVPRLSVLAPPAGHVLLHVAPGGDLLVFAEARGASVWRRAPAGGPAIEATLREGEAWSRAAESGVGTLSAGVSLPALQKVPRALADTLPRRGTRLAERAIDPSQGEALEARDLAPWLRAEPTLIVALRPRLAAFTRNAMASRRSPAAAQRPPAPRGARTATARAPRVVPRLALPAASVLADPLPSIAVEPTGLLVTERVLAALPLVPIAASAADARETAPRPPGARAPRPTATAAAATDVPKRR